MPPTHDGSSEHEAPPELSKLDIPYIPFQYDNAHADQSALQLVQAYAPAWKDEKDGPVVFIRFTDGITNTLTKATKNSPGKTKSEIDQDAILLRAYGQGTDVLIDRQREIRAHNALAKRNLAPELLARFDNGLMYRFVQGDVCTPQDLRKSRIYHQVAKRLGEWHSTIPIESITSPLADHASLNGEQKHSKPNPNVWSVMRQWHAALQARTEDETEQKRRLLTELDRLEKRFGDMPGLLGKSYIFGHCDLLSGNVIVQHPTDIPPKEEEPPVSFIDYEYATPSPAAFDIANHFAEWAGFDCDHTGCPTRSQRLDFIREYVLSFYSHAAELEQHAGAEDDTKAAIDQIYRQVDDLRGLPGLYWGIWALIQAEISQIDFNYAEYAQIRLGEYWAWKDEDTGQRAKDGREMPLRERRWAEA